MAAHQAGQESNLGDNVQSLGLVSIGWQPNTWTSISFGCFATLLPQLGEGPLRVEEFSLQLDPEAKKGDGTGA